jgi:hypothetical protein
METQQQNTNMNTGSGQGQSAGFLKDLENFFHGLYTKVPFHLPATVKELIVKVGPWITLIIIILAIPVILAAIGLTAFFTPFAMMYGGVHAGFQFLVGGLIGLLSLVLEGMALPGLFSRSLKGWQLLYYATLVNALGQLIRFDVIGLVIGLALSLYVLFEVKSYYK